MRLMNSAAKTHNGYSNKANIGVRREMSLSHQDIAVADRTLLSKRNQLPPVYEHIWNSHHLNDVTRDNWRADSICSNTLIKSQWAFNISVILHQHKQKAIHNTACTYALLRHFWRFVIEGGSGLIIYLGAISSFIATTRHIVLIGIRQS